MRVIFPLLFLTLVVSPLLVKAAPSTTTTVQGSALSGDDDEYLGSFRREDLPQHAKNKLFLGTGYEGGHFTEGGEYAKGPFFVVRWSQLANPNWDYEVQYLTGEEIVGLAVGRRWNCCEQDPYQPYARVSLNTFIRSGDELAGFVEIRRWRARAGLGVGEVWNFEAGAGVAVTGTDLYLQFGYNFVF